MQNLISGITKYIDYLKTHCNLTLSVHFDQSTLLSFPPEILKKLLPYNSHTNPYCMAVKKTNHKKCVMSQQEILKNGSGSFLRVCHAGVYEYIQPVIGNGRRGFIAVSGYRKKATPDFSSNLRLWKNCLSEENIPLDILNAVIPPLSVMLETLFDKCSTVQESEYNLILQFLNEYHGNISLSDLCSNFGRSKSHISHMFKSKSGITIREYCNNLKLEDARKLLSETDLSITEIAFEAGFNDASYFVHLFSQKHGITPLKYRKSSV